MEAEFTTEELGALGRLKGDNRRLLDVKTIDELKSWADDKTYEEHFSEAVLKKLKKWIKEFEGLSADSTKAELIYYLRLYQRFVRAGRRW